MSASGIRAGRAFVEIGANEAPLKAALSRISGKINAFGANLLKIGAGVAAAGIGAGALLAWPLKLASNLEQATTKFTTMLGSAEAATKMLADIRAMAAATPFEQSDLISATEKLLSYGVAADSVLGSMQMLGDASGGDAARFETLVDVFGKVSSSGMMMTDDMNRMIDAGFNPMRLMIEKTGESVAEFRQRMSKGGVSIDELGDALNTATSEGGQYFGLMQAQSQTLAGQFSTLKDSIAEALMPLGEFLLPIMKTAVSGASAAIKNIGAAWEIGIATLELGWVQLTGGLTEWVLAFQDVWTDVVTWIAQAGVNAFSGIGSAWDAVSTGIVAGVDWIWGKLQQLLELMQIAGEKVGLLTEAQEDKGKSVGDRLGEVEAERRARAKAREDEFAKRAADRARDNAETLRQLAQMGEAEKRARRGGQTPEEIAAARLKAAQDKFNKLIGEGETKQEKRQQQLKKSGEAAATKASGSTNIMGQFNASLAGQQVGFKAVQDRIAKATEATAKGVQDLLGADAGIMVT